MYLIHAPAGYVGFYAATEENHPDTWGTACKNWLWGQNGGFAKGGYVVQLAQSTPATACCVLFGVLQAVPMGPVIDISRLPRYGALAPPIARPLKQASAQVTSELLDHDVSGHPGVPWHLQNCHAILPAKLSRKITGWFLLCSQGIWWSLTRQPEGLCATRGYSGKP